jgi:hypothetical protein
MKTPKSGDLMPYLIGKG